MDAQEYFRRAVDALTEKSGLVDFRDGYMTPESAHRTARAVLIAIREAPLSLCWEAAKMGADRDSDLVQRQFFHIVDAMLAEGVE